VHLADNTRTLFAFGRRNQLDVALAGLELSGMNDRLEIRFGRSLLKLDFLGGITNE